MHCFGLQVFTQYTGAAEAVGGEVDAANEGVGEVHDHVSGGSQDGEGGAGGIAFELSAALAVGLHGLVEVVAPVFDELGQEVVDVAVAIARTLQVGVPVGVVVGQ